MPPALVPCTAWPVSLSNGAFHPTFRTVTIALSTMFEVVRVTLLSVRPRVKIEIGRCLNELKSRSSLAAEGGR